ncbi:transcriptional regulator, AraC family [Chitinophaga jiangningensis]|uniref:Transcriptional regulator, AraC family n=1 Tax=Chitinophaga jiangningensis TaxID=1419482 RepID=A0A1M6YD75_9BACT|nr:helix-turn-helix domain-containing protein [Chitinophaga jiangningensis]SHL16083.1 transcriptional regulator, AraC family [Chitinophaga jiangningensis]
MDIVTVMPHQRLKHVVKRFWYANIQNLDQANKTYKILADGAMGLVFQHNNGHSALTDTNGDLFPIFFAYGQKQDSPCINTFHGSPFVVGVNLQPTAFKQLFSINAATITNSVIGSEHIFPGEFTEQLLHAATPEEAVRLFSNQLQHKLQQVRQDKMIDHSVRLIFEDAKGMDSYELSSHFSMSRRQFQRKFKEHLGVSPETYLRIIRFQKAIHLLKSRPFHKLSDVGYSLNYADQSHFIREFKLFAGCTPKEFLSANYPPSNENTAFETIRILGG